MKAENLPSNFKVQFMEKATAVAQSVSLKLDAGHQISGHANEIYFVDVGEAYDHRQYGPPVHFRFGCRAHSKEAS